MRPDCDEPCSNAAEAVLGYGDPNADWHLIGDHPGIHGGAASGIPFTGSDAGNRLLSVFETVGLIEWTGDTIEARSLYLSYLHPCCPPAGSTPDDAAYTDLERLFDAELRAVAAHVLLPVGQRPLEHVLRHFTAVPVDGQTARDLHGIDLSGSGFLVVPIRDPRQWNAEDEQSLIDALEGLLASDYHQAADLTRFFPSGNQYLVR